MSYQVPNYLSNGARAAMRFGGEVWDNFVANAQRTPYGNTRSAHGTPFEVDTGAGRWAKTAATGGTKVVGEDLRRSAWKWMNPYRVVQAAGEYAAPRLGLSPGYGTLIGFGVPALYHTLTETSGPITQGLRPKGWQSVAPVSKAEDPTGRTPRNLAEETGLRFIAGQKSQPLPYQEFVKERPDVMPSTYKEYRRYLSKKPEAGKRLDINPDDQSFTALGGLVRGTARGLHDPEIRVRGVPVSANATLGTAAGLATVKGLSNTLNTRNILENLPKTPGQVGSWDLPKGAQTRLDIANFLGEQKDAAVLGAGALAAIGTAAVARKLFQTAAEKRIKKEDPVEYLRYKHGNFANAKEAMQQPEARNWQELSQYVN